MEGEGRRWPALLQSRPTASNIFRLIRNANMGALPPACSHPRRHLLAPKSLPPAKVFGRALPSLLLHRLTLWKALSKQAPDARPFAPSFHCASALYTSHTPPFRNWKQKKSRKRNSNSTTKERKEKQKSQSCNLLPKSKLQAEGFFCIRPSPPTCQAASQCGPSSTPSLYLALHARANRHNAGAHPCRVGNRQN